MALPCLSQHSPPHHTFISLTSATRLQLPSRSFFLNAPFSPTKASPYPFPPQSEPGSKKLISKSPKKMRGVAQPAGGYGMMCFIITHCVRHTSMQLHTHPHTDVHMMSATNQNVKALRARASRSVEDPPCSQTNGRNEWSTSRRPSSSWCSGLSGTSRGYRLECGRPEKCKPTWSCIGLHDGHSICIYYAYAIEYRYAHLP